MKRKLLLISNSTMYGKEYLYHCAEEIVDFLGENKEVLFIPYALSDWNEYESIAKKQFEKWSLRLTSIHRYKNPRKEVAQAESLFIGGGNTFRLLHLLYQNNLIPIIKNKALNGMSYIGASAGSNIACPTIQTTNDMPIVQPSTFKALGLVPFQINPHYIDADPHSKHKGETRDKRINEFHEENNTIVIGLREGAFLRIENNKISLKGATGAKIFKKGKQPIEYASKSSLDFLLR